MRIVDQSPALPHQPLHSPRSGSADVSRSGSTRSLAPMDDEFRFPPTDDDSTPAASREESLARVGSNVDGFERAGRAWFVATELQSDLVVDVGDMSFNLHKFPLLSRSGKLNRLMFDSRDTENSHIKLEGMPGGPEAFELAAKFCYGLAVELNATNVAALRCAAEYLEMTEDLDNGNLTGKTEDFIGGAVLASWNSSVGVLQSCEALLPWAEDLQIVRRCCESVAWKASTDPRGIHWSFTELSKLSSSSSKPEQKSRAFHASPLRNGSHAKHLPQLDATDPLVPRDDWWIEDICVLGIEFFTRVIHAIRVKGMRYDLIGAAVMQYATRWLPALNVEVTDLGISSSEDDCRGQEGKEEGEEEQGSSSGDGSGFSGVGNGDDLAHIWGMDEAERRRCRELIEALCSVIPPEDNAVDATFVLRMLRMAKVTKVDDAVAAELEGRAGHQLDQATVPDLLIPKVRRTSGRGGAGEIAYDVDLVHRMVDGFLGLQQDGFHSSSSLPRIVENGEAEESEAKSLRRAKLVQVARLVDGYLAEIGRYQNVTVHEFLALAESLPHHARATDNGLYKAVDTYLKSHPWLAEHDRTQLCRALDCQRLSSGACMHAAQNERLPLRVVVRVLFGEQIKLRNAISGTTFLSKGFSGSKSHGHPSTAAPAPATAADDQINAGGGGRRSPRSVTFLREAEDGDDYHHLHYSVAPGKQSEDDMRNVRVDVERMKAKFMDLQNDYATMQLQLEHFVTHCNCGTVPPQHHHHHHPKRQSKASAGWKKLIHPFGGRHSVSPLKTRQHHHQDSPRKYPEHSHHRDDASTQNPSHPNHRKAFREAEYPKEEHIEFSSQLQQQPATPPPTPYHREGGDNDQRPQQKEGFVNNHTSQSQASQQYRQNHSFRPRRDSAGYFLTILNDSTHVRHSLESQAIPETRDSRQSSPCNRSKNGEPRAVAGHGQAVDIGGDSSRSLEAPGTPTRTEQRKKLVRPFASAIRKWRNSIS